MKKDIITILCSLLLITSCKQHQNKPQVAEKDTIEETTVQSTPEGRQLLEKNCFLCHHPSTKFNERIAPPMIAIKARYLQNGITREEFISDFVSFSKNPTQDKAKMKGAVKRFNLMPKQNFAEKELIKIAEYIYDYKIEEPEWFKKHWDDKNRQPYHNSEKKHSHIKTEKTPTEIGLSYALGTKKVLGKNLMSTIQNKGTLEALQFCNYRAYPLTDSMSIQYKAKIKRVSDKPRNQKNKANKKEQSIIKKYKKMNAENTEIKPIVQENHKGVQFYYPIKTNSMCLQCHGTPNVEIKPTTLDELAKLYPNDRAIGYQENQIRGIWSIYFSKK